jgi:hypothetical protein
MLYCIDHAAKLKHFNLKFEFSLFYVHDPDLVPKYLAPCVTHNAWNPATKVFIIQQN